MASGWKEMRIHPTGEARAKGKGKGKGTKSVSAWMCGWMRGGKGRRIHPQEMQGREVGEEDEGCSCLDVWAGEWREEASTHRKCNDEGKESRTKDVGRLDA